MDIIVSLLSDLSILLFDLALYTKLTVLRKDTPFYRGLMYGGVVLITAAYIISAYLFHVPYGIASFCCMSVPSFFLFFFLSRYKNSRFLVTFCFVDTVTLVLASVGKMAMILGGEAGGLISCIVLMAICAAAYFLVRPYCPRYRQLMEEVATGWGPMAISTLLIYLLLIFSASYPSPMITRLDYLPVYILLCITILSFYSVFLILLLQRARLTKANKLLTEQQHWHTLAYLDELTQLANTAAFKARSEEMVKEAARDVPCALMLFDIDNFKHINDAFGHLYGNTVLKNTAAFFRSSFSEKHFEFFRVGGDEFVAVSTGIPEAEIREHVSRINSMEENTDPGCTYSCGYSMVDYSSEEPFRQAFQAADEAMYQVKTEKKRKAGNAASR